LHEILYLIYVMTYNINSNDGPFLITTCFFQLWKTQQSVLQQYLGFSSQLWFLSLLLLFAGEEITGAYYHFFHLLIVFQINVMVKYND